jgi:hypothetical protein
MGFTIGHARTIIGLNKVKKTYFYVKMTYVFYVFMFLGMLHYAYVLCAHKKMYGSGGHFMRA